MVASRERHRRSETRTLVGQRIGAGHDHKVRVLARADGGADALHHLLARYDLLAGPVAAALRGNLILNVDACNAGALKLLLGSRGEKCKRSPLARTWMVRAMLKAEEPKPVSMSTRSGRVVTLNGCEDMWVPRHGVPSNAARVLHDVIHRGDAEIRQSVAMGVSGIPRVQARAHPKLAAATPLPER